MRKLPVVTFMNKLIEQDWTRWTMDEVGSTLNLKICPLTWPVGMGRDQGVVTLPDRKLILFHAEGRHGSTVLDSEIIPLEEAEEQLGASPWRRPCRPLTCWRWRRP